MRFLILTLVLLPGALIAQKRLYKKAKALEDAGRIELAMEKYKEVLYRDAHYLEASSGLNRTAKLIVDQKLSDYFLEKSSGDLKEAIEIFSSLVHFTEELKYFNIFVDIPTYYFEDYKEDLRRLAKQEQEELSLKDDQENEHNYQLAVDLYNQEHWIAAWEIFVEIPDYKNTREYIEKIESKANRLTVIIDSSSHLAIDPGLENMLLSAIHRLNNPVIKVINRANLDQLIEEQKLALTGLIDENSAVELGRLLGVELILLSKMSNYHFVAGEPNCQTKTAYVARFEGQIKNFYPVSYNQCNHTNKLHLSLNYQLINVETAEVSMADWIQQSVDSEVNFATYQYDSNSLYPSNGTHIYKEGPERDELLSLFSADRKPLSQKELYLKVVESMSDKLAQSIDNYFRR